MAVPRLENENMVVQCPFWLPETRSAVAVSCYSLQWYSKPCKEKLGAFGEASLAVLKLSDQLATSRVWVAGPKRGRKVVMRSEEGETSMVVSHIRRKVSVDAALGRRKEAM